MWNNSSDPYCAVICLDRVIMVNSNLKVLKSVPIQGYIMQGQWQGYTLFVTTKVGFHYVTLEGVSTELFTL